jgi:cAMP-binding proteins - catabolite gene activator and regulatory subunit of cAMP-dependent protein kinases
MTIDAKALETIPILASLGVAEKTRILSVSQTIKASKRQLIIQKEAPATGLWILLAGRLQGVDYTIDGREVGLYFITPGQFFGELSLVDQKSHPEHIIATAASEILLIPQTVFQDMMKFHPEIAHQISQALAERVRSLIKQRTLLTLATPMQRLAAQLIDLSKTAPDAVKIEFIPTHQELAMMINASRETVTRAFRTLQTQG